MINLTLKQFPVIVKCDKLSGDSGKLPWKTTFYEIISLKLTDEANYYTTNWLQEIFFYNVSAFFRNCSFQILYK